MAETLRRNPAQQRGRDKVQRIVAAAETLLAEIGYDATVSSPQLLLAAADVSRGAFYSYFTNPEHVMDQLAKGYMADIRVRAEELTLESYATIDEVVAAEVEMCRIYYARPTTRELWLQGHLSRDAVAEDRHVNRYLGDCLKMMFDSLPDHTSTFESVHGAICVEMIDYLMRFAMRADPEGDPELVAEVRLAVRSYVNNYVQPRPPAKRSRAATNRTTAH